MKLIEYQAEAARTCPDLKDAELNNAHMMAGLSTEYSELLDAFKKNLAYKKEIDTVNLSEEWADFMWYAVNFARMNNISLILDEDIIQKNIDNSKGSTLHPVQLALGFMELIWDFIAYQDETVFRSMISGWYAVAGMFEIDTDKALQNNIAKLRVRFPEKFTEENALNRNLDEERKKLEN